jgi:LysR family nitrogen assimilation transcriptional regulator
MDLRQLRYFRSVVEAGGFSRAAERLNVAQSALSLQVRRLEESLGVTLLVRESTGARPTAAGLRLLEHAQIILGQVAVAERDLRAEGMTPSGSVSIGVPSGAGRVLIGPLISAGKRDLPGVSLQVVEAMTGHLAAWLEEGRVDLAVLYGEGEPLLREAFHLIIAPGGATGPVRLDAFGDLPLALPSPAHHTRRFLDAAAAKQGVTLSVEFEVDALGAILDMVREGRAVSLLTPAAFLTEFRRGELAARVLEPEVVRTAVIQRGRSGEPARDAVEALVGRVVRELAASGAWPERV